MGSCPDTASHKAEGYLAATTGVWAPGEGSGRTDIGAETCQVLAGLTQGYSFRRLEFVQDPFCFPAPHRKLFLPVLPLVQEGGLWYV